jgi:hypothetical protein
MTAYMDTNLPVDVAGDIPSFLAFIKYRFPLLNATSEDYNVKVKVPVRIRNDLLTISGGALIDGTAFASVAVAGAPGGSEVKFIDKASFGTDPGIHLHDFELNAFGLLRAGSTRLPLDLLLVMSCWAGRESRLVYDLEGPGAGIFIDQFHWTFYYPPFGR